jgi:hypothetical protein
MEELLRQLLLQRSAATLHGAAQQDGMFHAQRADRIQAQTQAKMFQNAASVAANVGEMQGRTQGPPSRKPLVMDIPRDQVINEHGQPAYMSDTNQLNADLTAKLSELEAPRWAGVPKGQLPKLTPGEDTASDSELMQYGPHGIPGMDEPYIGGVDGRGNARDLHYGHGPGERVEFQVPSGTRDTMFREKSAPSSPANARVRYPDDPEDQTLMERMFPRST